MDNNENCPAVFHCSAAIIYRICSPLSLALKKLLHRLLPEYPPQLCDLLSTRPWPFLVLTALPLLHLRKHTPATLPRATSCSQSWTLPSLPCAKQGLTQCMFLLPAPCKYRMFPTNHNTRKKFFPDFGPRVYPKGSLVIALVRPCVRVSVRPSLNISETAH